ncbi:hypothetical protein BOVA604_479 [Bacteroides ovatus]|jgi:hypothetical protein|uniref:hypothetical protein n=1 Tax=Bacteroides TaxID=816 RepID=UPI0011C0DF55|nr:MULTISPECIES: hypothetical protein [Bacteroides]MCS3177671.1 hypothetical protein [Candidatus Bacteroides intestinigallinarum]CAG9889555.1 hypothetical protein BOVA604_479 [Bacteroides ovatus]
MKSFYLLILLLFMSTGGAFAQKSKKVQKDSIKYERNNRKPIVLIFRYLTADGVNNENIADTFIVYSQAEADSIRKEHQKMKDAEVGITPEERKKINKNMLIRSKIRIEEKLRCDTLEQKRKQYYIRKLKKVNDRLKVIMEGKE